MYPVPLKKVSKNFLKYILLSTREFYSHGAFFRENISILSVLDVIQSVNMAFNVRRVKMYVSDLPHILSGSGIMAKGTFDR